MKFVLLQIKVLLATTMLWLFVPIYNAAQAETLPVKAWSYYTMAPYVMPDKQGFVGEFVQLLNRQSDYNFSLTQVTRKQLDKALAKGEQGVVLFANPAWLGRVSGLNQQGLDKQGLDKQGLDKDKQKYYWTPMLLTDQNDIISSRLRKVQYTGADSLKGLVFGGVLGRRYYGLEEAFKGGDILRYDVTDENAVLKLVLGGRVDVTSMPHSMVSWLVNTMPRGRQLFISPQPLFSFSRHIMLTEQLAYMHPGLSRFVTTLAHNSQWRDLLMKYQLTSDTSVLPEAPSPQGLPIPAG